MLAVYCCFLHPFFLLPLPYLVCLVTGYFAWLWILMFFKMKLVYMVHYVRHGADGGDDGGSRVWLNICWHSLWKIYPKYHSVLTPFEGWMNVMKALAVTLKLHSWVIFCSPPSLLSYKLASPWEDMETDNFTKMKQQQQLHSLNGGHCHVLYLETFLNAVHVQMGVGSGCSCSCIFELDSAERKYGIASREFKLHWSWLPPHRNTHLIKIT